MGVGWVEFRSFTVQVLSFRFGMRNLVGLLLVKVAALFLRNWLSQGMPLQYRVVACV
jgi:hypothetical protein